MLHRVGGPCASGVVYHLVEIFFFPDGVKYSKVQFSGYAHDKWLLGEPFLDFKYCLLLERFVSANFFWGVSFKDLSVFSVFCSGVSGYVMWIVPSLYSCLLCIFMVICGFGTHGVAGMTISYSGWFMVVPLWGTYSVCDGLRILVRFHLVLWSAEVLVIC